MTSSVFVLNNRRLQNMNSVKMDCCFFRFLRHNQLNSMERHINSLVDTIFENARATVTPQSCTSDVELQRKETADAELTFDEFCTALEKSKEICDVLNFFYNLGMPDVPIPLEALTKSSSRQTQRISNSPNALSECSSSFGHSSNPWEWFLFFTRQLCTFLKAWCGSLFSSGKTQFQLQVNCILKAVDSLLRLRFIGPPWLFFVVRNCLLFLFCCPCLRASKPPFKSCENKSAVQLFFL